MSAGGGWGGGWAQVEPTLSVTPQQIAAMSREERQAMIEKYAASVSPPDQKGLLGPDGQPGKAGEGGSGQWFPPPNNAIVSAQRRAGKISKGIENLLNKNRRKSQSQGSDDAGPASQDAAAKDDDVHALGRKEGFQRIDSMDTASVLTETESKTDDDVKDSR